MMDPNINSSVLKKYIIFCLHDDIYAIEIELVKEIKSLNDVSITVISNLPSPIKGITELSNEVTPIIDLRIYYQFEEAINAHNPVVIYIISNNHYYGFIVDAVLDLAEISNAAIKEPPAYMLETHFNTIEGIAHYQDTFAIILNGSEIVKNNKPWVINAMHKELL